MRSNPLVRPQKPGSRRLLSSPLLHERPASVSDTGTVLHKPFL
jgi:hypothetical protein